MLAWLVTWVTGLDGRRGDNATLALIAALCQASACGGRLQEASAEQSAPQPLELTQFLPALQKAICDGADECCAASGWKPLPSCRDNVATVWQPKLDYAREIGATYDPTQAARCAELLADEWKACRSRKVSSSRADDVCSSVFRAPGQLAKPGEPCTHAMDCQKDESSPIYCLKLNNAQLGACTRHLLGTEGAPCQGVSGSIDSECLAPFVCGAANTCIQRARLGESCAGINADACVTGAVCSRNGSLECAPAKPIGAPCGSDQDCDDYQCAADGTCRIRPDLPLELYCQRWSTAPDQATP